MKFITGHWAQKREIHNGPRAQKHEIHNGPRVRKHEIHNGPRVRKHEIHNARAVQKERLKGLKTKGVTRITFRFKPFQPLLDEIHNAARGPET